MLEQVPVQQLAVGLHMPKSELAARLLAVAERRQVPVARVVRGESLRLGGAELDILNPPRQPYADSSDNAVAFVLNVDGVPQALFLSDLSVNAQADLAFPDVTVLAVARHGSRGATSAALLQAARPEHAVISYGSNAYGHPDPAVVAQLEAHGAYVHATHADGAVRLVLGSATDDTQGAHWHRVASARGDRVVFKW